MTKCKHKWHKLFSNYNGDYHWCLLCGTLKCTSLWDGWKKRRVYRLPSMVRGNNDYGNV